MVKVASIGMKRSNQMSNQLETLATMLVISTSSAAETIAAITTVQSKGLTQVTASGEPAGAELVTKAGGALASIFLTLKLIGASDTDIKELTAKSVEKIKQDYPSLFSTTNSTTEGNTSESTE